MPAQLPDNELLNTKYILLPAIEQQIISSLFIDFQQNWLRRLIN